MRNAFGRHALATDAWVVAVQSAGARLVG